MAMDEVISSANAARITEYADTAKYFRPYIILADGVNRRTGVLEAIEHRRVLLEHGVPDAVIRYEGSSTMTRGNVELPS